MMTDNIEADYQQTVDHDIPTRFLPKTAIELVRNLETGPSPKHVLFDFDGTLSLIREGWADIMVPMMVDILAETDTSETTQQLQELVAEFVMELTGKQTIYQMLRLEEEVRKRGGRPQAALEYKQMYHDRLMKCIDSRREQLRSGAVPPSDWLVHGSRELLTELRDRGAMLYLASGTDECYVKEEVALLGLEEFFGEHVYGAVEDFQSFSKAQVIQRILDSHHLDGTELLGFGDGYVEIENVKAVGGIAVAVASDERARSGQPDEWKRTRLIGVGADIVVADYREWLPLIEFLWSRVPVDE